MTESSAQRGPPRKQKFHDRNCSNEINMDTDSHPNSMLLRSTPEIEGKIKIMLID